MGCLSGEKVSHGTYACMSKIQHQEQLVLCSHVFMVLRESDLKVNQVLPTEVPLSLENHDQDLESVSCTAYVYVCTRADTSHMHSVYF